MTNELACPQCGAPLSAQSPEGLCPQCLLLAGLASASPVGEPGETAPSPSTHDFLPPTLDEIARAFPQLEVLELIGRGGMGAVYKARQRELDRVVALKILPPQVSRDPAFALRFAREARALARLNHPHIVAIFDSGQSGGLYYLLMEYVDGVNLRQTIRTGELSPSEALAIVPQICDALQYAHDEGIVHRDIKPENILIDKRGRVKIADFGLAKLLASGGAESPESASLLTATAQVMGTYRYMAPEQMTSSAHVDHRADIYSLGVVFYELLTGEVPMGRFEPPSQRAAVDARLDDIVLRTLEREPKRRYQQAGEVKTDVQSVASSPAAKSLPARPAEPRLPAVDLEAARQEVKVPGVALVCLGVLCFVMSFFVACVAPVAWWLTPIGRSVPPVYDSPYDHNEHGDDPVTTPPAAALHRSIQRPIIAAAQSANLAAEMIGQGLFPLSSAVVFAAESAPTMVRTPTWLGVFSVILAAAMVLQWPLSVLMIVGGWRMQRLESHGLAVLASLVALLPCQPLFPLSLVIGIWSLFVLNRPHIKQAFAEVVRLKRTGAMAASAEPNAERNMRRTATLMLTVGMLNCAAPAILFLLMLMLSVGLGSNITLGPAELILLVTSAATGGVMIVGGTTMRRLRSDSSAWMAAVVALLPVSLLWPINIIVGIWALITLRQADVGSAMDRETVARQMPDVPRETFSPTVAHTQPAKPMAATGKPMAGEEFTPAIRSDVEAPALGLIIFGVLTLIAHGGLFMLGFFEDPAPLDTPILLLLVTVPFSLLTIVGGVAMHQCRSRALALLGSCAAMLPVGPLVLLGFPLGLWALLVLRRSRIRLMFHENQERPFRRDLEQGHRRTWLLVGISFLLFTALIAGLLGIARWVRSAASHDLAIVSAFGELDRMRSSLDRGADPNARDADGTPAIVAAAAGGHDKAIELLCRYRADVNARDAQGQTALMKAAYHGHLQAMSILQQSGAEAHAIDNEGRPALYWALVGGNDACVAQLFRFGSDFGAHRKDEFGRSMLAVAAAHCPASVPRFIAIADSVDDRDNDHRTPLMHAAAAGNTQAINVLLVNVANINAHDMRGRTPLDWAVYRDQESAVKLLLEKGAEKTGVTHLWEGYRLAIDARFSEAIAPLETAREKLPHNTRVGFQVKNELFLAELPQLFALAALAECQLRSGNVEAAREHYEQLGEQVRHQPLWIYTRYDLSPERMRTGDYDPDNYRKLDFTLTFDALQKALGEPLAPPIFVVRLEQVTTTGDGHVGSRSENTSSGTARGLFAK